MASAKQGAAEVRESIEAKGSEDEKDIPMGDADAPADAEIAVVEDDNTREDADEDAEADDDADGDEDMEDADPDADADGEPDDGSSSQGLKGVLNLIEKISQYLCSYKEE